MRWKLFATLAEAAGEKAVNVRVGSDEPTLREAFDALIEEHPELESEVLDGDGALQDHIRLLCDGEDPFLSEEGWETDISGVSELALFPPVSGG